MITNKNYIFDGHILELPVPILSSLAHSAMSSLILIRVDSLNINFNKLLVNQTHLVTQSPRHTIQLFTDHGESNVVIINNHHF